MAMKGIGYSPGHITGLFSIHDETENLLMKGSRGAGLSLSLGSMANITLTPPSETNVKGPLDLDLDVSGVDQFKVDPKIYRIVIGSLLPDYGRGWQVKLRVRLQLPVSQGFGMSAAGALSASIAIWEALHSHLPPWERKLLFKAQQERYFSMKTSSEFKIKPLRRRLISPMQLYMRKEESPVRYMQSSGRSSGIVEAGGGVREFRRSLQEGRSEGEDGGVTYSDCISAAHRADILVKGGLGDVVAAARGGLELRLSPGLPPFGEIHNIPVNFLTPPHVAVMVVGDPIETSAILANETLRDRVNNAGQRALEDLLSNPTMETFMMESNQFSRSSGLQSLAIKGAILEVEKFTVSSQIMIGNSVFAVIGGTEGAGQIREVVNTWRKKGKVTVCDIDLIGARPIN